MSTYLKKPLVLPGFSNSILDPLMGFFMNAGPPGALLGLDDHLAGDQQSNPNITSGDLCSSRCGYDQ